jgi:hypothetical protein
LKTKNQKKEKVIKMFRVRTASIIGRDHILRQANNQDAFACSQEMIGQENYIFAAVADGCGEGKDSEVGAKLVSQFVVGEIPLLLKMGVSLKQIPQALFPRLVGFLGSLSGQFYFPDLERRTEFVGNLLLTTVLGLVMNNRFGLVFIAGDGIVILDDRILVLDQENKPTYLGYHLIERKFLQGEDQIPKEFKILEVNAQRFKHLAICSDGFELELASEIWGFDHPRGLQRQFNLWSRKRHFQDDATIITVENLKP